jgi:nucleotide-binding universal stress UspA family protein
MYDRILVPTDGSEAAATAVDHALDLAGEIDSAVHVVIAVPFEAVSTGAWGDVTGASAEAAAIRERNRSEATRTVEAVAERARKADVDVETAVLDGRPGDVVLNYADEHDCDLVVMGTHGRTGVERYVLGSVTERVVRLADRPVLTVHPSEAPTVDDVQTAREVARSALFEDGHDPDEVTLVETPHRGASAWVVRAETPDGPVNVHVGFEGETRVAHLNR